MPLDAQHESPSDGTALACLAVELVDFLAEKLDLAVQFHIQAFFVPQAQRDEALRLSGGIEIGALQWRPSIHPERSFSVIYTSQGTLLQYRAKRP
jgi:hypothetical protein